MKRVLCLIESLGSGGAERQMSGLAVMLKQSGYDIDVCYYVNKTFYREYLESNGVRNSYLSDSTNPRTRLFALMKHIKQYAPDTVISYSASPSMICCISRFLGARFNLIVSERNTTQQLDLRERIRFYLYRWANHIVPNSQSQKEFIDKHFSFLSQKITVITNFVDTEVFSPSQEIGPNRITTRMICVGRLMPQKNILRFIHAVSRVIDDGFPLQVDWFGQDLQDEYASECHKAIANYHLAGTFNFHAPSSSIHEEYRQADVFCLPSLFEGFPNVLCEAMSCGLPVLCSRVCDNPNIVKEGQNGLLFNPHDSNDIARIIEKYLLFDKDTKTEMSRKGREIAIGLFSKERFINNYLQLL